MNHQKRRSDVFGVIQRRYLGVGIVIPVRKLRNSELVDLRPIAALFVFDARITARHGIELSSPAREIAYASHRHTCFEAVGLTQQRQNGVPATLSDGARVTDALRELIAENLRPFVEIAQHPLVELSGGFDSGYGHSMQREAAYFDFDAALDGSIVADLGFMDISQLLDQAHAASNGGFSYKLIGALFWLLKLERIYQRYLP